MFVFCYLHEIQISRKFMTYLNYIFTQFDNRRISYCGKIHVPRIAMGMRFALARMKSKKTNN